MQVTTTKGLMDDSLLQKKSGVGWVEYWLDGELVHRSATAMLSTQLQNAEGKLERLMKEHHLEFATRDKK